MFSFSAMCFSYSLGFSAANFGVAVIVRVVVVVCGVVVVVVDDDRTHFQSTK